MFQPVLRLLSRSYGDDIAEGNRGFSVAMAILAHVCERMLTGRGGATHREILDALAPVVVAQSRAEGRPLNPGQAEALVDRVLNELQNSGQAFRTEFFDYATGRLVTHTFRILDPEASRERGAYRIKLTPAGIDLFFRLKEIYSALETDMERLFIEYQLKRGHYAEAGRVVESLLLKITRALEAHRELRGKLRSNPADVSADKVDYFGRVVAEEPVCLKDMDAAEVRACFRFLLWLHNRTEVVLAGLETREPFERLQAEEPAWGFAQAIRVRARPGWFELGGEPYPEPGIRARVGRPKEDGPWALRASRATCPGRRCAPPWRRFGNSWCGASSPSTTPNS